MPTVSARTYFILEGLQGCMQRSYTERGHIIDWAWAEACLSLGENRPSSRQKAIEALEEYVDQNISYPVKEDVDLKGAWQEVHGAAMDFLKTYTAGSEAEDPEIRELVERQQDRQKSELLAGVIYMAARDV
jgi:acetylornithine/succinyldiaminopimelate/putrescine aminotransferase